MQTAIGDSLELVHQLCCLCGFEDADPVGVGEDFEYRTSADTFVALRCRRCGLIYLNPRPATTELDRIYPPGYHAFDFTPAKFGLAHTVRSRLEARRLLHYARGLSDDARIIDVGCGDGFHLQLLRDYGKPGWRAEGIDTSERAVGTALQRGLRVTLGDIRTAALEPDAYDLALLIATVEHIENPLEALIATRRVLKPGGRVAIVTDNTNTLDFQWFGERHWGGYHFPRHWNLFNGKSLRILMEKAGFKIEELTTTISPVNWVYSIRNRLTDRNAPEWLVEQFSLKSPASLAVFTLVDWAFQLARRGALLRVIGRKPC